MKMLILLGILMLSSCATVQNNHDPMEGLNRATDNFNELVDRSVLKPLATGYVAVTAQKDRKAVSNFYDNITYSNTILNDFLQGKGAQGFSDLTRFIVNSTVGLVGLIDVASHIGLEKHNEDFGQTLAVWGLPQGAYIVYPFFGPSSVRNTPDFITATATDGLFWLSAVLAPEVGITLAVLKYVEKRSRLLDISAMRDELSLDPYIFSREAWRQHRQYLIHDGPPARSISLEADDSDDWGDEMDDEWADEAPE